MLYKLSRINTIYCGVYTRCQVVAGTHAIGNVSHLRSCHGTTEEELQAAFFVCPLGGYVTPPTEFS
jgi:hypothetical protein